MCGSTRLRICCALIAGVALTAGRMSLAGEVEAGSGPTVIQAVLVEAEPVIDGRLDEACWSDATRFEGFYCQEWGGPGPEETMGLVCASERALYVAVVCKDETPGDIVASETRRNGDMGHDDRVEVAVDPLHNHREFYGFEVNAGGAQRDYMPGDSATKIEWRGDWKVATCRTAEGWQAEFAIPFSILRFPPGQTTFGLEVSRSYGREQVTDVWPNLGKAWDHTLGADLVGLAPRSAPPRPIYMPYLTLDTGDGYDRGADAGLDVQYKMDNGITALGSYNPDFRQIEDVVEPISFSYTERYLRDPRPFFVTGGEGYLPREHLFYTRRIRDFDSGLKLFGTVGNDTIGIMDAVTFGEENSLAAQLNHRFDDDLNAKVMMVSHRQVGEPNNLAYGLDACYRWRRPNGADTLWTVLYETQTQGGSSGGSYAIGGAHQRGPGKVNYDWMARVVTEEFNPALGYWPETNNIGGQITFERVDLYEKSRWYGKQWGLNLQHYPYLDGSGMFRSSFRPAYYCLTTGGELYGIEVERGRDHGYDNSSVSALHAWHNSDTFRRGQLVIAKGKAAGGDLTYASVDQGLRPLGKLSVRVAGEYTALTWPDGSDMRQYQAVLTSSYDLTTEKSVAARAIWRDSSFSAYAAYRQVVRKGMDAYVILGDPDPTRTGFTNRVVVKLIWAL